MTIYHVRGHERYLYIQDPHASYFVDRTTGTKLDARPPQIPIDFQMDEAVSDQEQDDEEILDIDEFEGMMEDDEEEEEQPPPPQQKEEPLQPTLTSNDLSRYVFRSGFQSTKLSRPGISVDISDAEIQHAKSWMRLFRQLNVSTLDSVASVMQKLQAHHLTKPPAETSSVQLESYLLIYQQRISRQVEKNK